MHRLDFIKIQIKLARSACGEAAAVALRKGQATGKCGVMRKSGEQSWRAFPSKSCRGVSQHGERKESAAEVTARRGRNAGDYTSSYRA